MTQQSHGPDAVAGSRPQRGALRFAIVAFALLIAAAFWTAALILGEHDLERTLGEIDGKNRELARTLSEHATRTFDYADRIAREVKAQHEHRARDFDIEAFGRDGGINRQIVVGLFIADASGEVHQVDGSVQQAANIVDREHFKYLAANDSGQPYISRPLPMRTQGGAGIMVSQRLNRRGGEFDGIVSVAIRPDAFTGFYREIGLGAKGLIALTGLDGFVRARNIGEELGIGQDVRTGGIFKEYSKGNAGTIRFHSIVDGVTRRVAFRKIDGYPLVVNVGVDEEAVLADVRRRVRTLYASAAAGTLLALLAAAALLIMVRRRDRDAQSLRESEERFRQVTENIDDVFWLSDPGKDHLLYISPAYAQLWGRSTDSLYRSSLEWIEGIHADDRERVLRAARTQQVSGEYDEQYRVVRPDGSIRWVRDRAFPVRDAAGNVVRIAGVAEDITDVREHEQTFRHMVESSPDAVFINRDDAIVYANPAALKLLRATSADQLIGLSPLAIVHADDRAAAGDRIARQAAGETPAGLFEQRFVTLDGTVVDTEISVAMVFYEGQVSRHVVARDVTQRKAVEAALRVSEARYRRLVEESPDATFINRGDTILYANPAALRLLGADRPEQVIGCSISKFVDLDHQYAARAHAALLDSDLPYAGGILRERQYVRLDGSVVDVEVSVARVALPDGNARQVVVRDISVRNRMQAALRESELRYRLLVETSPDGIIIFRNNVVSFVNSTAVELLGAPSAAAIVGRTMLEFIHADGQAAAIARVAHMVKSGQPTGLFEQTFVRFDGSNIEVEGSATPLAGAGSDERMVVVRDVSARKRAEAALHESEARLRIAAAAADMTDWEWDVASDQTYWGHQYEKLLGPLAGGATHYPDFREMVHVDDRARFLAAGRATLEQGAPYEIEFRFMRTDSQLRWLRSSGRAMRDAQGKVERMVGVAQDVTRRHDIERELAESNRRRDALMESIPAPAWLKDRDGRLVAVNRAWCARFGRTFEQAIGRTSYEVFSAQFADEREKEDQEVIATRAEKRVERSAIIGGRTQWFETVKTPIIDEHGEVSGIAGVLYDVTVRKQAEIELRTSEERFREFAESAFQVFWIYEANPVRVVYVNRAFTSIWGMAVDALYANPLLWTQAIHTDERAQVAAAFEHWLGDTAAVVFNAEYPIVRPDGEIRWIRDRGTKLRDAAGKVVRLHGIAEDITQQRMAELALAESRQSRDALLEGNPSPSWLKDSAGRYIVANRAWFARHAMPVHDIAGKYDRDFFDAERDAASRIEDQHVMDTRKVMRYERKGPYADGAEYAETVKAPLLDSAGNVVGIVGISHDISARKHSEDVLHELNKSLAHKSAELSALNTELEAFSYSVSHDLRAPLRRISGFGNFLLKDNFAQLDNEGQNRLQRILAASEQMGRLIDDLLTLARISRQSMSLREVNLDVLATQALGVLAEANPGRRVEIVIEPALKITADAGLMRVVVDNLIGNAWKFTGECAHARIEMGVSAGDGERVYFVRDNGAGFDMTYAGKLFAPFQRLHAAQQFEGTGIGLATVKRIIARHEGRIWVESAVDRGTTVYFTVGSAA